MTQVSALAGRSLAGAFAVTVSWLQVLSTTYKSTDGTRSHWKYVVDNAIVYRGVYRADSVNHAGSARYFRDLPGASARTGAYQQAGDPVLIRSTLEFWATLWPR